MLLVRKSLSLINQISLLKKEVEKINADAQASYQRMAEGAAGKRIFNHCLGFYNSRRLDSIANATAPTWEKITNIQEEISKHIPSF